MKSLGLFEARNRLSEVCEQVASTGEPCLVTRRGRPLVRIVPVEAEGGDSVWSTLEESRSRYGRLKDDLELPERAISRNRSLARISIC
jgi:prevent-host-death family protein